MHLATGGGKTTVFSHILKGLYDRGNNGAMIVRGRQLVDQASERIARDEVRHGVMMANHWRKDPLAPVQVCSIDTLIRRKIYPKAKLVVIDEAHLFTSESCVQFMNEYPDSMVLAVTATPWTQESLRHVADVVIHPISVDELMAQGYLVRPRYFAPSVPNLKGVKTVSGDWVQDQLKERMSILSADIVQTWCKLGEGRPTVGFAVNIEHSLEMVDAFNRAGIRAEHIEAKNSRQERAAAIQRLITGQTQVLWNVGILCTGVDIPPLSCIISARPTQSYNLYIQQMGRGTRPVFASGMPIDTPEQRLEAIAQSQKKDFLILDHAGNIIRHGFITNEPDVDLDGLRKQKLDTGPQPILCPTCYLIYQGPSCPTCGPRPKAERIIEVEDDELKEISESMPFAAEVVQFVKRCKDMAKKKGFKRGWVYYQVRDKYGQEVADELFPKRQQPTSLPPWLQR